MKLGRHDFDIVVVLMAVEEVVESMHGLESEFDLLTTPGAGLNDDDDEGLYDCWG